MFDSDFDEFQKLMVDLCIGFNVPVTDDRVRVFYTALKDEPIAYLRVSIAKRINAGGKFPQAAELKRPAESRARQRIDTGVAFHEWVARKYWQRMTPTQRRLMKTMYVRDDLGNQIMTGIYCEADEESPALRVMVSEMTSEQAFEVEA